jgi:hypothetical protein
MMAGWEDITLGDYGFEGRLRIKQRGVAQDISGFATMQYTLRSAKTRIEKTVNATFLTDGTDGWLTYTFAQGDIDAAGRWRVRAVLTKADERLTSDWHVFEVEP